MNLTILKGKVTKPPTFIQRDGEELMHFTITTSGKTWRNGGYVKGPIQWHNIICRGWHTKYPIVQGAFVEVKGEIVYRNRTNNLQEIVEIHAFDLIILQKLNY